MTMLSLFQQTGAIFLLLLFLFFLGNLWFHLVGRGNSIDVRLPLLVLGNKSTDRSYPSAKQ